LLDIEQSKKEFEEAMMAEAEDNSAS